MLTPKESRIFLKPENVPITSEKLFSVETLKQPKQVVFHAPTKRIFVSCMVDRTVQVFQLANTRLALKRNIQLENQPVELLIDDDLLFVTTTGFEKNSARAKDKLFIIDIETCSPISSVETGGNWSKFIAIRPQKNQVLVTNWNSNTISVIDIEKLRKPKLKQLIKWGEAPRGIAFLSSGNLAVIAGYYSRNIGLLKRDRRGKWEISYTGPQFDYPNYSGNMRDVIITPDDKYAIVSNMGRNLVHLWSIKDKKYRMSISVGKYPNSMCFMDKLVGVSCRKSSCVYFIDTKTWKVFGRSELTGREPTGLSCLKNRFLVTCFGDNTLELHQLA